MKRQYVLSPITHTKFVRHFAMSWQRRGNVVAFSRCDHVTSTILASVNGA